MKIKKGETYSEFIKRIRLEAKLTQMEFALQIGYNRCTISLWENGKPIPRFTQRVIDEYAKNIKQG